MASKKSKKPAPKAKTTKPVVNKSEFIRSHANKPPQEIMKLAKSKGIDLSIAMVYTILSEYRKKQGKSPTKVGKKADHEVGNGRTTKASPKPSGSLEQTFVAAIIELGAERAEDLFQATLAKVRAIGGK
jgi:hypothetical protein